jgi:hypothetical protein
LRIYVLTGNSVESKITKLEIRNQEVFYFEFPVVFAIPLEISFHPHHKSPNVTPVVSIGISVLDPTLLIDIPLHQSFK